MRMPLKRAAVLGPSNREREREAVRRCIDPAAMDGFDRSVAALSKANQRHTGGQLDTEKDHHF